MWTQFPQQAPRAIAPSSAAAGEIRAKLFESAVTAASESYKENARITGILDDKAQKAAQTAGLFLAAGFALMKPGTDNIMKYVGWSGLMAMAGAVGLLMGTAVTTLIANWLRKMPAPLNPERVQEMAMPLAQLPDGGLTVEHRANFLNDLVLEWTGILSVQQKANRIKARLVRLAQLFLALAILLIGFLLILVLRAAKMQS